MPLKRSIEDDFMNWWKLIASIFLCQMAGAIGSLATFQNIAGWYLALNKPFFTPPNWAFGPVWLTLYLLMGIAFFMVWNKGLNKKTRPALQIFGIQLALNTLWSIVFFGFQSIFAGLVVIVLLWLAILWTMARFWKISRPAGWLLVPYIVWVTIATALNAAVWLLN
jgi:tryptophan-rich sensory protein